MQENATQSLRNSLSLWLIAIQIDIINNILTPLAPPSQLSVQKNQIPVAPAPYDLADFSSRSALVYLAAAIIFMDLVIFWMFVTDLIRFDTAGERNV